MRTSRREVYRFILTFLLDNDRITLCPYDEGDRALDAAASFLKVENYASLKRKLSTALRCLVRNGWAYRFVRNAHKYYIGEPTYYIEWSLDPSTIRRLKAYREHSALFEEEMSSLLDRIPIN